MCQNCGVGTVRLQSWLKHNDGKAEFMCLDCGWKGDAKTFRVPCTACGCSVPWPEIELNAECDIVCRPCYLKDPPAEDVAGMFHDAHVAREAPPVVWLN